MENISISGIQLDTRYKALVTMLVKTARQLTPEDREKLLHTSDTEPLDDLLDTSVPTHTAFMHQILKLIRVILKAELDQPEFDLWALVEKELLEHHIDGYLSLDVHQTGTN